MFKNWMLTEIPHFSVTALWLYCLHSHVIVFSTRNVQSWHFSFLLSMKVLFINERINWKVFMVSLVQSLGTSWKNETSISFLLCELVSPVYVSTSGNPCKWRWNLSLFSWPRSSRQKSLSGFLQAGRPLIPRPATSAGHSVQYEVSTCLRILMFRFPGKHPMYLLLW